MLLALILWCDDFTMQALTVLGDSTSALQDALNLAGRHDMVCIAREVAWRQIIGGWQFKVGHLPAEHNLVSDALSRRFSPDPLPLPRSLASATERRALDPMQAWRAAVHFDLT